MMVANKSAGLPPIYRAGGTTYHPDTCEPLRRAQRRGQVRLEAMVRGGYPGRPLPDGVLEGIRTVGYWDAVGEQDWGLEWHRNEGIEFCLLESGAMPFAVDDHRYRLRPGDLTFTRPWQKHVLGDPRIGPGRLHWIILDVGVYRPNQPWRWPPWIVLSPDDLADLTGRLRHVKQHVWRATPAARACFHGIARHVERAGRRPPVSFIAVHVNLLLLEILNQFRRGRIAVDQDLSSDDSTVALFLRDLRTNPNSLSHPWTVPEMAERCGVSEATFSRICRRAVNTSPSDYLLRSRLSAAAELLRRESGRTVLDVAMACGFSSSQYFATAFRRLYGRSPRDERPRPPD